MKNTMHLKIHIILGLFILSAACSTFAVSKKSIQSKFVKITVTRNGVFEVLDKQSGVVWHSTPFGEKKSKTDNFDVQKRNKLLKLINKENDKSLTFQLLPDGKSIDISYESLKEKNIIAQDIGLRKYIILQLGINILMKFMAHRERNGKFAKKS